MWRVAVTDLLNLSSVVVLSHADEGDLYRIRAAGKVVPTAWPNCKSGLFRHGNQMQRFMDTPMHGKRALVEIERQRYRCRACGKTVFEPLPDMDDKRQMTSRLLAYIEKNSLRKTFSDLAREVGGTTRPSDMSLTTTGRGWVPRPTSKRRASSGSMNS